MGKCQCSADNCYDLEHSQGHSVNLSEGQCGALVIQGIVCALYANSAWTYKGLANVYKKGREQDQNF